MSKPLIVAPSILSADFGRLAEEIKSVADAGCEWIHVDVMDGHFVPNITIGPVVVEGVRKHTRLPLDVHLMISDPATYIEPFAKAGSDYITIHYEACDDPLALREHIRSLGAKAGISVKPKTALTKEVLDVITTFDLVLIMTVEPGFGGQSFMTDMVSKISTLRSCYEGLISVDGGINDNTVSVVRDAGVDVVVAGSYVFGKKDRKQAIDLLKI